MTSTLQLEPIDESLLNGECGAAAARAMRLLVRYAQAVGASRFVSISSAHIDGCMYHGPSGIEFARRFVDLGGSVRVPTTLNTAAADTVHLDWNQGPGELVAAQQTLIGLHKALGCLITLTCAPYQRTVRPKLGEHIAWGESNAIVFANSVLGAKTDRYGDFTDLSAAMTGRVPMAGLHLEENRLATVRFDVIDPARSGQPRDLYFAAIGYLVGSNVAGQVPLITGLPGDATEDELKALGAAAASSGSIALFHALGITPEAQTLAQATGGRDPVRVIRVGVGELRYALDALCPLQIDEQVGAMCLGTPHFSRQEFALLARAVEGRTAAPGVEVYVSTSREIAAEVRNSWEFAHLEQFGVRTIVDTCPYVASIVRRPDGAIVTNSAKFAHYAPGVMRRRVGLMTLERCVRSAELGRVPAP